jgi:UTP--glucose-1-phosphate uridylyltransferase
MAHPKVRKAVIAAAGFGTRFLPFTKAMPKEMLPLVDKPIIQYIVEELVAAGIEDVVIVTGYHKRAIEDHFDQISMELGANLKNGGKHDLLNETHQISTLANFVYVRQKSPYGNAGPLMDVEHLIGDEPFIYTFADDFVRAQPSRFQQLLQAHESNGGSVLTCIRRDEADDYKRYGYVGGEQVQDHLYRLNAIIEKPGSADKAPSNLATVSGYVLEPSIFTYLHEELKNLTGGEFLIQPAMQKMMQDGLGIYGCEIQGGSFYDTGNKLEYVKTVFDFALERPDMRDELCEYLKDKLH